MRILINTYDTAFQNQAGGVRNRIEKTVKTLRLSGLDVDYFDKYTTKIEDYDVLHIFKLDSASSALVDFAYNKGVKIVVSSIMTLEKGRLADFYWRIKKIPIATLYKRLFNICDKTDMIIAETPREALFMQKYYHIEKERIIVIPNGADTNAIKDNLIYEKIGGNMPYALVVARFDQNKNQLNVIRAMRDTDNTIVFVGGPDPSSEEYYQYCLEEAKDSKNIVFLGWLDSEDSLLKSAYGNAKVIVCPSYNETFGLSIIEGIMAGAIPAISNTLPLCEYDAFKNCFRFNPNDVSEIKETIVEALNSYIDDRYIKNVQKQFSWDSVARKHIEVYRKILKLKKS